LDLLPEPAGQDLRLRQIRVGQNQGKLLPTVARQQVRFPHAGEAERRQFLQNEIPCLVAEGIIDRLKMVDISHDERQGTVVAPKRFELALQEVLKCCMIIQTSEPVTQRQLLRLAVFVSVAQGQGNLVREGRKQARLST